MRVKGDRMLRKDEVVVAYGGGQFGSTMKGKRAVPVKLFRRALSRYVTVVLVDEYRTSRVCSNRCILESVTDEEAFDEGEAEIEDAAVNFLEEDEGGGGGGDDGDDTAQQNTRRPEYVLPCFISTFTFFNIILYSDLEPVREQRDTYGNRGPSLHAVRHCKTCHTVWNRDVNAARNIAWVFWWLRCFGCRPYGFRRRGRGDGSVGGDG
jgi:hypothetical protein